MLDVQANRVDHAVGARNSSLYGALIMCIGANLFNGVAITLPQGAVRRCALWRQTRANGARRDCQ